jgi:hypothetical protein
MTTTLDFLPYRQHIAQRSARAGMKTTGKKKQNQDDN